MFTLCEGTRADYLYNLLIITQLQLAVDISQSVAGSNATALFVIMILSRKGCYNEYFRQSSKLKKNERHFAGRTCRQGRSITSGCFKMGERTEHEEIEQRVAPQGFQVAYDGLAVEF